MPGDHARIRLTERQRCALAELADIDPVPERFYEAIENILNHYLEAWPGCANAPRAAACAAALSRFDRALSKVLSALDAPEIGYCFEEESRQRLHHADVANQVRLWQVDAKAMLERYKHAEGPGRPSHAGRDMLLHLFWSELDAEGVDREYQADVLRFACAIVGVNLPEPSKLERLLAKIRGPRG